MNRPSLTSRWLTSGSGRWAWLVDKQETRGWKPFTCCCGSCSVLLNGVSLLTFLIGLFKSWQHLLNLTKGSRITLQCFIVVPVFRRDEAATSFQNLVLSGQFCTLWMAGPTWPSLPTLKWAYLPLALQLFSRFWKATSSEMLVKIKFLSTHILCVILLAVFLKTTSWVIYINVSSFLCFVLVSIQIYTAFA